MLLVDPEVTKLKLDREIELWQENEATYRKRGWILLDRRELEVEVGFLAQLQIGPQIVPVMTACVRLDYTNYDLWPPSVEFINVFTGEFAPPPVQAFAQTDEGLRNLLVGSHPDTNRPFFCVPGTRQYHEHPQHSGDSWLLHRGDREGSLITICERIWRSMARSLVGLQVQVVTLPPGAPQHAQLQIQLVSGDVDALRAGAPAPVIGEAAP